MYLYSSNQEPIYQAKATLLVRQRESASALKVSDYLLSKRLSSIYARMLEASPFLSKAIQENDLPQDVDALKVMVSTGISDDPPSVDLKVNHSNPEVARTTANILARGFIDYMLEERLGEIARLQGAAAAQGLANVGDLVSAQFTLVDSIVLLEPVGLPESPILPRTRLNVLLATVLGVVIALPLAILLGGLRDTVHNPEEISRRFGVTTLGTVFRWSSLDIDQDDSIVLKLPSSAHSESFKQIRAQFQFATAKQPGTVYLVTSPGPQEGKTTIIRNLSVTLAQSGKRVIVVDGDLRRPAIHRWLPSEVREPGLSNYLAAQSMDPKDVIYATQVEGISAVPAGTIPPNPSELLGSPKMSGFLEALQEEADIVLVDSPPILIVADASLLAAQVDGVVVVVDGFNTRSSSLKAALDTLGNTQVNIVGVILNKLKRVRFGYTYGYGYPYYYGGYVNRCVNVIRRRPSQPLIQWRFHPHTVHRDRRLGSTQGPSDA